MAKRVVTLSIVAIVFVLRAIANDVYRLAFENLRLEQVTLRSGKAPSYVSPALPTVRIDLSSGATSYAKAAPPGDGGGPAGEILREVWVELKAAIKTDPLTLDAVRVDPPTLLRSFGE